jgi:diguanylate cyclase (GGDEF)-like protein/PAS domain S-box-containing protein
MSVRRRATHRLRARRQLPPLRRPEATQALAHELQVHQIELEMQNEQLRQTQAALEAARDRYADLYDFAPVGYVTLDAAGLVVEANLTAARLLRLERTRLVGSRFARLVAPADHDRWQRLAQRLRREGQPGRIELALHVGDGQRFDAQLDCLPMRESAAAPAMRVTLTDISDRRRIDAELRLAAAAFETQEGILITDAGGVIERVNRAFTAITGHAADEAVGQSVRLLQSDRHDTAFYAALWDHLRRDGVWQGEVWSRRKCGEVYPLWLAITAVRDDDAQVLRYVGTLRDISESKSREAEIEQFAFYDAVTGLPNRRLMKDRLQQALALSARTGHGGAVMFIDLDRFKSINDTLGHDAGDRLLQQVAQRLLHCVRAGDTVARLGGDEFVVVLSADLSDLAEQAAAQASAVGAKILAALRQPYEFGGHGCTCTASIGLALFNDHAFSTDELLKRADHAMYQAKAAGRDTLRLFDAGAQALAVQRATIEAELRRAIELGQFMLQYQPVFSDDGSLLGAEALVRWQHPQRGLVAPEFFIPIAEETGLIRALGRWVLETACAQVAAWAADADMAGLTLSVNVSATQLRDPGFVALVLAVLERSGAPPTRVRLELTETAMLDSIDDCVQKMQQLHVHGVRFSLDDFGTGYASLTYLKRLPLDQLKIDGSFVRELLNDPHDAAIARAVTHLGNSLGLTVVAEGVETVAQRDCLLGYGCRAFQGHLFGRPQSAQALREMIRDRLSFEVMPG